MDIVEISKSHILYEKALELRYRLFFQEHKLPRDVVVDGKENDSRHIAIHNQNELVAYGRFTKTGSNEFQISQMVVAPTYQKRGCGSKLLKYILATIDNEGSATISLNARTTAKELYLKHGFIETGGTFLSKTTGVPHVKMVYEKNT